MLYNGCFTHCLYTNLTLRRFEANYNCLKSYGLAINVSTNILQHYLKHFGSNDTFRKVKWLCCMDFQITLEREWLTANVAYRRRLKEIFSFTSVSKLRLLGFGHISETAPHESGLLWRQECHKTVFTSFILA